MRRGQVVDILWMVLLFLGILVLLRTLGWIH